MSLVGTYSREKYTAQAVQFGRPIAVFKPFDQREVPATSSVAIVWHLRCWAAILPMPTMERLVAAATAASKLTFQCDERYRRHVHWSEQAVNSLHTGSAKSSANGIVRNFFDWFAVVGAKRVYRRNGCPLKILGFAS